MGSEFHATVNSNDLGLKRLAKQFLEHAWHAYRQEFTGRQPPLRDVHMWAVYILPQTHGETPKEEREAVYQAERRHNDPRGPENRILAEEK